MHCKFRTCHALLECGNEVGSERGREGDGGEGERGEGEMGRGRNVERDIG